MSWFKKRVKHLFGSITLEQLCREYEKKLLLSGRIKSDFNNVHQDCFSIINDFEFSVFSQSGEDGIIQHLINNIDISKKIFVEFGVENYKESNTRFLLMNNNWSGLVIDNDENNITEIKGSEIYWKYDLMARKYFITKENINEVLVHEKIEGEIGLLSIDIDGNDYWVWNEISVIRPDILIIEYNSLFGKDRHITIPYINNYYRFDYHYSGLVFGASLPALVNLSEAKGYYFVGCNSMGNNAFFVNKRKIGKLKPVSVEQGYKEARFRESRDKNGIMNYKRNEEKYEEIKGTKLFNIRTNQIEAF